MGKSLYSLILSDEVIRKIDVLAHRNGTNRSNYINQILAEHASITTPERRINDIFGLINDFFGNGEIVRTAILLNKGWRRHSRTSFWYAHDFTFISFGIDF